MQITSNFTTLFEHRDSPHCPVHDVKLFTKSYDIYLREEYAGRSEYVYGCSICEKLEYDDENERKMLVKKIKKALAFENQKEAIYQAFTRILKENPNSIFQIKQDVGFKNRDDIN